jgi:peptidoglycan hydrolase-like protein with peptidoglycan-binding domain
VRALAILFALLAVPIAILLALRFLLVDRLDELDVQPEPIVVAAEVEELTDDRVATAALTWGDPEVLRAPSWQGLVTDVYLRPGDRVATGVAVASVAGIKRIAAHTERPFWRPLNIGDRGEDVREAQRLLTEFGFYSGEITDIYGDAVAQATARWVGSLGDGAPDGSFNPDYVVWLPVPSLVIADSEIEAGLPAPAAGTVLVRGPQPLVGAAILSSTDQPVVLEEPMDWEFAYADASYGLAADRPTRVRGDLLDRLSEALTSDSSSVEGVLRRRDPVTAVLVPAAAVTANAEGDLCIWVPSGSGFAPRPVEVGEGTLNRAQILTGLLGGEAVLANPATYLPSTECP